MTLDDLDVKNGKMTLLQKAIKDIKLPYDNEIQWLKSTGSQWIDTCILPKNGMKISVKVTSSGSSATIYGGGNSWGSSYLQSSFGTASGKNVFYFGYGNYAACPSTSVNWSSGQTYEIVEDDNQFYVNDSKLEETSKATFESAYPISLFCYNRSGSKGEYSKDSIHYFKIEAGENALIDLIPVRFTNEDGESEGAMYDKVSGKLLRNAGTGKFILGPDKE